MGDMADMALSDMMDDDERQLRILGYSRVFLSPKGARYEEKRMTFPAICPACGAPMIRRNGPYGPFKGCSNFPKCKAGPTVSLVDTSGLNDQERFIMDGEI